LGEEKANRDNAEFKNRRNLRAIKDIPKVNRDKNACSTSPQFRPSHQQMFQKSGWQSPETR
jgi:hypothetical protein